MTELKLVDRISKDAISAGRIDVEKSLLQNALDNGKYLPSACRGGVCYVCKCKVIKGLGKIKKDKFGEPMLPLEDDEVLSCIAGVKEGKEGEIVLEISN